MKILLIIYDNQSYMTHFPIGTAYIAAALRAKHYDVTIWDQNIGHMPDEALTDYLDTHRFHCVGLGVIGGYYQYKKLLSLSEAINASKYRSEFKYVIGGHGPSPEPEYFLKKTGADFVVIGEGEETFLELLDKNFQDTADIKSLAPSHCLTKKRVPIRDLDKVPFPAYDLFDMSYYRLYRRPMVKANQYVMPIITSRGCPYNCNFCYRMDIGYRLHSVDYVIEHIQMLQKEYGINYIFFTDELFMFKKERALEFCEKLNPLRIKWECQGRLDTAYPTVLKEMAASGCMFINYGIESVNDEVLKQMNKNLTFKQIKTGLQRTLDAGIVPGYNVIWGNIGDSADTLQQAVKFLLQYNHSKQLRTIRPVTPYPGTPLFKYAVAMGKLNGVEDFYENKHVNSDLLTCNFTDLTNREFYMELHTANEKLLNDYHRTIQAEHESVLFDLYYNKNALFRGFRQT